MEENRDNVKKKALICLILWPILTVIIFLVVISQGLLDVGGKKTIVAMPVFTTQLSEDGKTVTIKIDQPQSGILYYTLDGSDPTEHSAKYEREITVDRNVTLKRLIVDANGTHSQIETNSILIDGNSENNDSTTAKNETANANEIANTNVIANENDKKITNEKINMPLQVIYQVTYQDAIDDPAYNYKTVNFSYQRPVFSETSPALANINATYDRLESEWQAKIPAFTTKALNYWNRDTVDNKLSHIKYDTRSQMEVVCNEVYNKNNLLSIQQDVYSNYVGSTHGYHELTAHTFNIQTGEELMLGDILSIDESQIKAKLTDEFAKLNDEDIDLNDVYEQLGPSAKYYLTDAGVCVYFNQYEVACYAANRPTITIPYSRTDLLKPIEAMIP